MVYGILSPEESVIWSSRRLALNVTPGLRHYTQTANWRKWSFFYITPSFQEALLIMQIKCVVRLTAPWVCNAPITRYSATIWCFPRGTFGYVNENDHIWEASFWQGELRLLLVYRDSLIHLAACIIGRAQWHHGHSWDEKYMQRVL